MTEAERLKVELSTRILGHVASELDMTVPEYGSVYDSEKHEQLLNDLVKIVQTNR